MVLEVRDNVSLQMKVLLFAEQDSKDNVCSRTKLGQVH